MPNMFTSQDFIYQLNLHYTLSELILTAEDFLTVIKTNSPILMYMHLLNYREENFFSYQTIYDLVDRSLDSLEFPT